MKHIVTIISTLILLLAPTSSDAAERFVSFKSGDLKLNGKGKISIYVDANDCKGVSIAANNLASDINKVCGAETTTTTMTDAEIIVGTIGHSAEIKMVKAKVIDKAALKGKREKYIITTIGGKVVIAGSDRRGTIYGIYELSRQIGVSPWYYWADTPIERHESIYINKGVYTDGEPAVRYRGIFLNDEELGYEQATCKNDDVLTIGDNYKLLLIIVDAKAHGLTVADGFEATDDDDTFQYDDRGDGGSTNPYDHNARPMDGTDAIDGSPGSKPGRTRFVTQ